MSQKLFSQKINVEGWTFLIISPGTILYRGDSLQYIGEKTIGDIEYFSDEQTSKKYGLVSLYRTSRLIKLLAMDELSNVEKLYSQAPENVRDSITESFGYTPENKEIKRESDYDNDFIIARYICSQGLDGYAHEAIQSETESHFHPEVALCEPLTKLELSGHLEYTQKEIEQLVSIHRLHIYARDEKKRRTKRENSGIRRTDDEDRSVRRGNLFGDEEESSNLSDEDSDEENKEKTYIYKKPNIFYL